jgi:hypothetical protein
MERGDLFGYQKRCRGVTTEFADASDRIMAISRRLRELPIGAAQASRIIDRIQASEQLKLSLTVKLQMAKQQAPAELRNILATANGDEPAEGEGSEDATSQQASAAAEMRALLQNLRAHSNPPPPLFPPPPTAMLSPERH